MEFVYNNASVVPAADEELTTIKSSSSLNEMPSSSISTWDEEELLTLHEAKLYHDYAAARSPREDESSERKHSSGLFSAKKSKFPFFLRLTVENADNNDSKLVNFLPLYGEAPRNSLLRLSCLTLPPYRIRAEEVVFIYLFIYLFIFFSFFFLFSIIPSCVGCRISLKNTPRCRRRSKSKICRPTFPAVIFFFFFFFFFSSLLFLGMLKLQSQISRFLSFQIVDLLRYVPLNVQKRRLLCENLAKLSQQKHLIRETWAPRLCRENGPQILTEMLPKVAFEAMQM
jgi:hypothetical protein